MDKICLITGGSRGIGKAAAIGLAQLGATLGIVARDRTRGETAVRDIENSTGNSNIDLFLADLSSQAEVRRLAGDVLSRYPSLHVLINNAGAINSRRTLTVDGLETTFAVNHLAPFLLTNLLSTCLKESAPARVIAVSSVAHRNVIPNPDNLQGEEHYKAFGAYGLSKLANILFTYELARRLDGTGVTANCLHPGIVSSGFGRNDRGLMRVALTLAGPFLTQPAQGAGTIIYLASSPEVEGVTGKYFIKCRPVASSPISYDEVLAEWLWDRSAELTHLTQIG